MRKILMVSLALICVIAFNFAREKYTPKEPKSPIPVLYRIENKKIPKNLEKLTILSERNITELTIDKYKIYLLDLFESLMRTENIKSFDKKRMEESNRQMEYEGKKLQQLLRVGERGPDFVQENIQFFNDCTFESKLSLSIRAVCLFALQRTFQVNKISFNPKKYPKKLLKLYNVAKGIFIDF